MATLVHPYFSRLFHTPLNSGPPRDVVPVMRQVQPDAEGANATPIAANPAVKRPVATVVVPAWNAWEFTERCLRSLRPTLGSDDQVVVVDNGSTDGTRAGLAGYEWVEVVANDQNLGFARACNQGAALARGSIVVFLNSDTIVPVGWLDELLRPFEESDVGAVGPRSDNVSGNRRRPPCPTPMRTPGPSRNSPRQWRDRQQGHTFRGPPSHRVLSCRTQVCIRRARGLRRALRGRGLRGR